MALKRKPSTRSGKCCCNSCQLRWFAGLRRRFLPSSRRFQPHGFSRFQRRLSMGGFWYWKDVGIFSSLWWYVHLFMQWINFATWRWKTDYFTLKYLVYYIYITPVTKGNSASSHILENCYIGYCASSKQCTLKKVRPYTHSGFWYPRLISEIHYYKWLATTGARQCVYLLREGPKVFFTSRTQAQTLQISGKLAW